MAEAVKPTTSKSKLKEVINKQEKEEQEEKLPITDQSLEKRLKSLKSFINNIEPTVQHIDSDSKKEEIQSSNNETNEILHLTQEPTKIEYKKRPSLVILEEKVNIYPTAPIIRHQQQQQQQQQQAPIVHDYNLEKIKNVNKLNYPKLVWNRNASNNTKLKDNNNQAELLTSRLNAINRLEPEQLEKNLQIDAELTKFFDKDLMCKELEVYYKCKQIDYEQMDKYLDEFIKTHSNLNEFYTFESNNKHEFYELVKDYYEARLLVKKCISHMNQFKWECLTNQMRLIWAFEKYTIEASGICGDQQRVKHELTSEKAYLNKTELNKFQSMLFDLRLNLIKNGLISAQFCSKLARIKIESYLHNFLNRIKHFDFNKSIDQQKQQQSFIGLNADLKVIIDILFYFNRKQAKPSPNLIKTLNGKSNNNKQSKLNNNNEDIYCEIDDSKPESAANSNEEDKPDSKEPIYEVGGGIGETEDDEEEENYDESFKTDLEEWLQLLVILLTNQSEYMRQNSMLNHNNNNNINSSLIFQYSNIHFENVYYLLQHYLHSPDTYATNFSYLLQVPLFLVDTNAFNSIKHQLDTILKINSTSDSNKQNNQQQQHQSVNKTQQQHYNLFQNLNLNSSQSDLLVKIYFDFYLKLFALFSYQVKYRKQFLFINFDQAQKFENFMKLETDDSLTTTTTAKNNWELIDQDGDAESLEQTLIDISEDDLIKLYYQIPFNSIFSFLWAYLSFQIADNSTPTTTNSGNKKQKLKETNSGDEFRKRYVIMKILSFLDNLSKLSIRTLLVYNRTKYKNFSKLIGKTLKDSIKFASLIITNFVDVQEQEAEKFYQHYDMFVKRIFATIIYSTRVKSIRWTLLSQLNISQLCLRTKWLILSIMTGIDVFHENFENLFNKIIQNSIMNSSSAEMPQDFISQSCENDLESILNGDSSSYDNESRNQSLSDIELLSFMRSIHFLINLEKKQDDNDDVFDNENIFMQCVIKVIFKIAYCYESTREICHKEGNSLLFAICSKHPQLIGTILNEIDLNLDRIGKKALYLGADLPFNIWLPYIDLSKDINFIEKCLLSTVTNSILFNLATKCIDNLNFNINTTKLSTRLIKHWNTQTTNSFKLNPIKNGLTKSHLIQIKLAFILFELHSRLTIYNYFQHSQCMTPMSASISNFMDDESFQLEINYSSKLNISSRDELNLHYTSKLSKEKRLTIVNWIWSTLNRMNLFYRLESIEYLETLNQAYSAATVSTKQQTKLFNTVHLNLLFNQFINKSVIHNDRKCPIEKYFNLVFYYSNTTNQSMLDTLIEPNLLSDTIQSILGVHTNKPQLMQTAYYLLFNWIENIIFKYSTTTTAADDNDEFLINDFRLFKQTHASKLSGLFLAILNPVSKVSVDTYYCAQIYKRLNNKNNCENNSAYLSLWCEILISSIKNWHKYKNIVKLADFLIAYSMQKKLTINTDLLDEFMNYVRIDFNIIPSIPPTSTSTVDHQQIDQQTQTKQLNWFETSLSFVSSTASHLTESLINTVNYQIMSSNDFDANQPVQFTYDKRIYKEFPFVGLYLSLCEERLESQLSIWSTLRSCLLSNETNSNNIESTSYIEACWRKTLQAVNKTHGINVNFSYQRLMMFKWCERALELPHDHPLLIIYWQKFFSIYLDKDFNKQTTTTTTNGGGGDNDNELSQQSSNMIKSPSLKLLSSSLIKQIKKQLELTSQHYAYIDHKNNSNQHHISSSYESNEFMSKLYYALSLWSDETRLHDPNLFLPALPEHYEPNLLAKIYSKQSEIWFNYIDLNKLKNHVSSIINNNEQSQTITQQLSQNDSLFFKQEDRLVQHMPNMLQLNVRLQCALKEKFGPTIESLISNNGSEIEKKSELQLILNISEHLIRNIFKYNEEVINKTFYYMLKLDDKLTSKLLTNLWNNELCEKYIQVACTSLINPMHQCTRPGMIKFVYELATKRDQYRHEIKENRYNYEKLLTNFLETTKSTTSTNNNRFPNDDVVKSMVSMNQLVKLLLRNYHHQQQANSNKSIQIILTRLFYLLIDLYESHMQHSNDVLNSLVVKQQPKLNANEAPEDWSILTLNSNTNNINKLDNLEMMDQYLASDSIHLCIFDLINLIGSNFIQILPKTILVVFRKKSQQVLLEKIIEKLTNTRVLPIVVDQLAMIKQTASSNNSCLRKSNNLLLNLTHNKLALMSLCAQFVEPNDLDLFNELYNDILCSIRSILLNNIINSDQVNLDLSSNYETIETINYKLSIILQLISKFSFFNLNKLLSNSNDNDNELCTKFVDTNINFLMDLKLESNLEQKLNDNNLKLIIDQCFDNFVSILSIQYPFYFSYMLQKCLDFSSQPASLKYGSKHLVKFNLILQQNEFLQLNNKSVLLNRDQLELIFKYLSEFFCFEREKYKSQTRSFYNHWFCFIPQLNDIYTNLFQIYLDRYVIKDLMTSQDDFERKYDKLWNLLLSLYSVWIDPKSILELTSQSVINVKEIFDSNITVTSNITTPGSAVLITINSFLNLFNIILERFNLLLSVNAKQMARNYALNKFLHFYYEQIACSLNNTTTISSINENTLDCFHKCINKYSSKWFKGYSFEPDYRSINILSELCSSINTKLITFIAFDLVAYLDMPGIIESYFKKEEIKPIQINDLLKCWLQLLTEFCLRDSIRESSSQFDTMLRPIYSQAEQLECWSMLSDASYSDVVIQRFCQLADYRYAFASRGTDRGLLMNLLKSSAEFYSLADNNFMSSFSSAKRRLYLKALSEILLKPTAQTIRLEIESFQNCIMNLLTDIETFAISSSSSSATLSNNDSLRYEIQLLIDELLCLISNNSSRNLEVSLIYAGMFEAWLESSKDSPILIDFINRISKNYTLVTSSNNAETYCSLLELCIEVYFQTDQNLESNWPIQQQQQNNLYPNMNELVINSIGQNESIGWKRIMNNIEFKLNTSNKNDYLSDDLFEYKFLQHSSYLLLYAYMSQRLALFKAVYSSNEFIQITLGYTNQILDKFLNTDKLLITSRPKEAKEEKFILIFNRLIEFYIQILNKSKLAESRIVEQLVQLGTLLTFYGEETLSNQNPINDSQSLLASIGINILAKKSPFSVQFRLFSRCMSVSILKKLRLVDGFYALNQSNDTLLLSSSPATKTPSNTTDLSSILYQKYKQAAYQFHLIFQTKSYSSDANLIEAATYVSQYLQNTLHSSTNDDKCVCLTEILDLSKYLNKCLFKDKYYLF